MNRKNTIRTTYVQSHRRPFEIEEVGDPVRDDNVPATSQIVSWKYTWIFVITAVIIFSKGCNRHSRV